MQLRQHLNMIEQLQTKIIGDFRKDSFKCKTENSRMHILRQNPAPALKKGHESPFHR